MDAGLEARGATGRRVLFVAGTGRSGTSTLAGIVSRLGLHVPTPEVPADESNPRGFSEPQWAVDVHSAWLAEKLVQVSDARPSAWAATARVAESASARAKVAEWLAPHFDVHPELVVKDPRLSWFLGLWADAARQVGSVPVYATMLRAPAEVVGSKQTYYANKLGTTHLTASWVNMLLHTELATRGASASEGGRGRAFVRYADLLADWRPTVTEMGETLGLRTVTGADAAHLAAADAFVDPQLHRVSTSLDDLDLPTHLREIAAETWESLNRVADPAADTPAEHAVLDQLREAYVELYEEAAAITRSSQLAARLRGARAAEEQYAASGLLSRIPHGVRAAVPASVRKGLRKALGRSR